MKKQRIGFLATLMTTLIWGSSFVIMKNTLDALPVMYLLAFRFTVASVLMGIFSIKQIKAMNKKTLRGGVVMGIFLFLAYTFQTYGLDNTTPGRNAFLTAVYCVIVPFLNWGIKRVRPDKYNISAAILCIIGVALISLTDGMAMGKGELLTLIGGLMYGFHIIATESATKHSGVQVLSFLQFVVVAVLAWCSALFTEPMPQAIPAQSLMGLAYLSVFCTAICFFLQTVGQKLLPASQASIILTFESVFGVLFSVIFYNEVITLRTALGCIFMFAAVIISETKLSFIKKKELKKS